MSTQLNEKTYRRALFIFRRDLRLEDNRGLIFALEKAVQVLPCFIFTPQQITHNSFRSNSCLQFMLESLEDLEQQLHTKNGKLYLFFDEPEQIVAACIEKCDVDLVVVNRDYTPYSLARDKKIEKVCKQKNVPFFAFEDALIHAIDAALKSDGKPYTVFTPFYKNALKLERAPAQKNPYSNYFTGTVPFACKRSVYDEILPVRRKQRPGGRKEALAILKNIGAFASYGAFRDYPAEDATTHLSAHLKFTTCSIREVCDAIIHAFGAASELLRSLYWRDFFTSIAYYFPQVFRGPFQEKFSSVPWEDNKEHFAAWCEGMTGIPIVDAGMRELQQTGFIHNRVRLIAGSFLVKDLHIDWRKGEKFFAQHLMDYDPAVNNGNWQWVASTGCDAQPYFRIFNPWMQQKKFDEDCLYIKRWVPELGPFSPKEIHDPDIGKKGYPRPIVDHWVEAEKSREKYFTKPQ